MVSPSHLPLQPRRGPEAVAPIARTPSEARWRLLSDLGQALSGQLESRQVLRELASRLVPELADFAVAYLLEGEVVERVAASHADSAEEAWVQRLIDTVAPSLQDELGAGAAMRTGQPYLASEISRALLEQAATNADHLQILNRLRPISSMILPLRAQGRTLGAVALATTDRSGRHYGAPELEFARELADRAALSLDNARLYGEAARDLERRTAAESALRSRYEQLRVLYEVNQAVGRTTALEQIYDQALDALLRTLGVSRASILLFDDDGVLRFKAWRGLSGGYRRAVEGHTPWSPDTENPAPIVVEDVENDEALSDALRQVVMNEGIRALAFIPLVFGSRLLGKFMLYYDQPHVPQHEELEVARTIAGSIAFAITRARDEQSVRFARDEAERANEAKSRFLGVMSHELRTPLNAIGGYVELLQMGIQGPVSPKQLEALSRIAANQCHLLALINDILSFARLEAGQVEYAIKPLRIRDLILNLEALVAPMANARGTAYLLDTCLDAVWAMGDEERIRQILVNLVTNAIKFAPPGSWVRVSGETDEGMVTIRVRDNGPGIPSDKLEVIFDPFIQVEINPRERREGAGLGLAISRELARGMGGDLVVRSAPGEGSEFELRLLEADEADIPVGPLKARGEPSAVTVAPRGAPCI